MSGPPNREGAACLDSLEFDGNTVLCRVCGDKASGFHYGVHACEGCKGFFRRSIQQKIQYRPCLKNQQCSIMRVNRNRCQYCRLKKCIAVGMSRDAVRFGRVPKREKAKIIEQMQKVNAQSQITVLNSLLENEGDVIQKIIESHFRLCDFTRAKFRSFFEKAWSEPKFVNCPAYKACPLNPSPNEDEGINKWEEFSDCFTPAIRNVVNFAKCIPGFSVFSQEDQVTLLKAGTFEVLLVHLAPLFDARTNTMLFANGTLYKRVSLTVTNSAGFLLDSMFDFAERLNEINLKDEEIGLFSALVIIASDRPGLRYADQIARLQAMITQGLQTLIKINHPDDPSVFSKLLMKIPDLRTLNTLHSEKLLGLTVPPNECPKDKLMEDSDQKPLPQPFPSMLGSHEYPHLPMPAHMPYNHCPIKSEGTPIVPHHVSLDAKQKEIILQTSIGTFHRNLPPHTSGDSAKEAFHKAGIHSNGYTRLPMASGNHGDKGNCSSPEPLELDLHDNHQNDSATSKQNEQMPRLSPIRMSPNTSSHDRPGQGQPKVIAESIPNRKRLGPDGIDFDKDPKLARLWDYDMRSQRSDSLSSNSSLESVDSAYKTISNPGTPRNSLEPRSPFPSLDHVSRAAHLNMPTLKGVLSAPPLNARGIARNTDSVGSADSRCSVSSPDPHNLHKKFRLKQSLSRTSTPEATVSKAITSTPEVSAMAAGRYGSSVQSDSERYNNSKGFSSEDSHSKLSEKNPAIVSSLTVNGHHSNHHYNHHIPYNGLNLFSSNHLPPISKGSEVSSSSSSHPSAMLSLKDKILKRIDSRENLRLDTERESLAAKSRLNGVGFSVPPVSLPGHSYFPMPYPTMHPALLYQYSHLAAVQQHMLLAQQQHLLAERQASKASPTVPNKDGHTSHSPHAKQSSSSEDPMNLSPSGMKKTSSPVSVKPEPI